MDAERSHSLHARVAAYRARQRERGMRPVQIWVRDTRDPDFANEANRQSALAAASAYEADDQVFVDAISWWGDEEEE